MASLPRFSAAEAALLLGAAGIPARLQGSPEAAYVRAAVDSRKAQADCLFVALPGERTDGHDHALAALGAGASVLLLSESRWPALQAALGPELALRGAAALLVPETLPAFQALAREKRRRHPRLFRIGITGSSGKTTTKEILASILGRSSSLVMNPGNLNSDIGLALSMFEIGEEHEVGVFEMGMNRRGEMAELARIFEPDYALITNVGTAHIGILGSREAIAIEKKQIFSRFDGRQVAFLRESEEFKAFLREGLRGELVEFGPKSTKGFRGAEDLGLDGYAVDWEGRQIRFPLVGRHNLENALAALSLAARWGTPAGEIVEGLEAVRPLFGRSEILRGEVTVIRDCYNANPESAEAALGFCDSLSWRGRRVYALGSMLELGAESEAAHRGLGEAAARSAADALLFFGEECRPSFEAARKAGFPGLLLFETDIERLGAALKAYLRAGDLVLLKASRGMALERLADRITGK